MSRKFRTMKTIFYPKRVYHTDVRLCRIHDVKPSICRDFPRTTEHAEESGCRGFVDE